MTRFFLTYLLLISFLSSAARGQDNAEVVAKAELSLLKIEIKDVGQGSGFVIDSTGIAVTNVHVMAGAENGNAIATFPDGKVCKIKGSYLIDKDRDIAVIQLDIDSISTPLPPLEMAFSLPRKGDEVLALGSPLGLSFSATRGIISAIRGEEEMKRDLDDESIKGTWIQVDAALSPGNSGGPLINKKGELVGMSTRASFGQSQNLNFGISVDDIREAVDKCKGDSLVPLSDGLANISMDGEPKRRSGSGLLKRKRVPVASIKEYIERGRQDFSMLKTRLTRELSAQKGILEKVKYGMVDLSMGEKIGRDAQGRFFFGSDELKHATLNSQEERVNKLNKLSKSLAGSKPTNESLLSLLWNCGPSVEVRKAGSVGFLAEGIVVFAPTENDVVIEYQDKPFLMWVPNSSGLAPGEPITPAPVFVVGSKTIEIPDKGTVAVTIIQALTESELKDVVFEAPSGAGSNQVASSEFRKWKDKSGKFEVEATMVSRDTAKVKLKKRDGSTIEVPLSKLSDSDLKFLKSK